MHLLNCRGSLRRRRPLCLGAMGILLILLRLTLLLFLFCNYSGNLSLLLNNLFPLYVDGVVNEI